MRIRIVAVGRLRAGPEATLIQDYLARFEKTGRALSLGPVDVVELDAKRGGQAEEAGLLMRALDGAERVIGLDERGKQMGSPDLSQMLARLRDDGVRDLSFIIGGADGLTAQVRQRADMLLSFGKMVWPHMLARVMLAEQLYRAASIEAGSPYHRV